MVRVDMVRVDSMTFRPFFIFTAHPQAMRFLCRATMDRDNRRGACRGDALGDFAFGECRTRGDRPSEPNNLEPAIAQT